MPGDAFALFFPEEPVITHPVRLRGYASRYARLDVYARTLLILAEIKFHGPVYAVIPFGGDHRVLEGYPQRCMSVNERELVGRVLEALTERRGAGCIRDLQLPPERLLHIESKRRAIVRLAEDGSDISVIDLRRPALWVMGAHKEPRPDMERIIRSYASHRVSIGPLSYLASHTALYVAWWRMR